MSLIRFVNKKENKGTIHFGKSLHASDGVVELVIEEAIKKFTAECTKDPNWLKDPEAMDAFLDGINEIKNFKFR